MSFPAEPNQNLSSEILAPISLYDFLGIPPNSPPNLIYLAVHKLQNTDWAEVPSRPQDAHFVDDIERYLHLVDRYLMPTDNRLQYETQWAAYYLPSGGDLQSLQQFLERSQNSDFFRSGLRSKSLPLVLNSNIPPNGDAQVFDYASNFLYFMMHDLPENRKIFFLNPHQNISQPLSLVPTGDKMIRFAGTQFYLIHTGGDPITISNDAVGKLLTLNQQNLLELPLRIGDRLEFNDGSRFILRSLYYLNPINSELPAPDYYLYFTRENVCTKLDPKQVYIIGRNTTDILRLPLMEEKFCFVNVGRRERSISRQNLQIFFHQGQWYIQDLGSRYGTTLDFPSHCKFETLSGGAIMRLEPGRVRLGYDKSYIIEISTQEIARKRNPIFFQKAAEFGSVYDLALLC